MRSINNESRITMNSRRNFVNYADMTLSDGTVLHLKPSDFRIAGQSFTDDCVDGDSFQIGTALGKTDTLLLDNTDGRTEIIGTSEVVYPHGKFSEYDFYMAYFTLYVCLPEAYHYNGELRDEMIPIGRFTVTTPTSHGATIEIVGVDNMYLFDKSFDECDLNFEVGPTLLNILNKCCDDCNVLLATQSFDNDDIKVYKKPEGATYRQVVSWIAQIAGCNAVITETGALRLKQYDMSVLNGLDGGTFDTNTTPYSDGDVADGGMFNPWNEGDRYDGGSFGAIGFHNLAYVSGTSVSTDDIQFTGVSIKNGETSAHYPDSTGWDYYAMVIEDNPFTEGHESDIALSIYDKISGLKFRPFTTSSIQDPTIEAGDPCVVYDVKGNSYNSIITNVVFKTGGMTELSCKAEPPARQSSRYVNSAAYAVSKAEKNMDDYNTQVAYFNEIANESLGYYKTVKTDDDTGALITYLHNEAELDSSDKVVMINSGGVFISDNYNTPQRSWNSGLDTSTATMLLNLIYVHGLTSDWIRTGELDVGGINNEDGIIRVTNNIPVTNIGSSTPVEDTVDGNEVNSDWLFIGPGQINESGLYKVFYKITDVEVGKPELIKCQIQKRDKWDGSSYTYRVVVDYFIVENHNDEFPIRFEIDMSDTDKYYAIRFTRVSTSNAGFTVALFYNKINTVIDKDGVKTIAGYIGAWTINNNGISASKDSGNKTAVITPEELAVVVASNVGSWATFRTKLDQSYAFLDYGRAGNTHAGFYVAAAAKNDSIDLNNDYTQILNNSISVHTDSSHYFNISSSAFDFRSDYTGGHLNQFYSEFIDYEANLWLKSYAVARINVYSTGANMGYYYGYLGSGSLSDRALKEDIKEITAEQCKKFFEILSPSSFNFKSDNNKTTRYGVIAQNVEDALEDADLKPGVIVQDDKDGLKSVLYTELIGLSLAGIKHLYEIIEKQQQEIDSLKQRLDKLEGK